MQSTSLGPGSPACLSLSRTASVALGRFQSPRGWSPGQGAVMFQDTCSSLPGKWVSMRAGIEPDRVGPMPASESSLGCLFAHRSSPAASEKPLWDASPKAPSCLEALRDPQCQPLFQYLLQATASGTAEQLAPLHQLLQPLGCWAWVGQCSQAVPTLLQAFLAVTKGLATGLHSLSHFDAQYADGALANQLALLLLERSDSLYQVPLYDAQVHRVLSSQFLALCRRQPSLVVELAKELLDFVGSASGHLSAGLMRTSMSWVSVLFEVTQSCHSAALLKCPPQVATILMTTLTMLASWSQVLIPRDCPGAESARLDLLVPGVSLLLSKMTTLAQSPALSSVRCEGPSGAICMWATDLLNLLKMPSFAQFMFTASMVSQPRLHHDASTALPLALCIVSQLVEKEAGLLPGEGPVTRGAPAGSQIKSLVSSQAVVPVLREESRMPSGSLDPQRWSRLSWSPRGARISQARSPMTVLGCGEAALIIAPALCGWM
ncbi:hypothetical protein MC885_010176 [Smutsia gigantea]|nr:hypothetical protein MC885_010176 [Smutsia gigantea]